MKQLEDSLKLSVSDEDTASNSGNPLTGITNAKDKLGDQREGDLKADLKVDLNERKDLDDLNASDDDLNVSEEGEGDLNEGEDDLNLSVNKDDLNASEADLNMIEGDLNEGEGDLNKDEADLNASKAVLNVTGATDEGSEFRCKFHWTRLPKLKDKITDRMDNRQKSFIRFTVPAMGYTNSDLSIHNETRLLTWVWVFTKYDYMLHYPHNFIKISLAIMGIITEDFALDYNNSMVPVRLSDFSFDIDDDWYEHVRDVGHCDPECVKVYNSCGVGKKEIAELIDAVAPNKSEEWEYVCLEMPYNDHIFDITGSQPSFVLPGVVYYLMFFLKLVSERPFLGIPLKKHTFIHYQCYKGDNLSESEGEELLEKYIVIPLVALVIWLYIPLFIHFFPSSKEKETTATVLKKPVKMFASHKHPTYLGGYLKQKFCYYAPDNSSELWTRARRSIFLALIWFSAFRIFFVPHYIYGLFVCVPAAIVLTGAMLYPLHISKHITPGWEFTFMGCQLPEELVQKTPNVKEYQLLALVMRERAYMISDKRFWSKIWENFWTTYGRIAWISPNLSTVFRCALKLLFLLLSLLWYFVPLPFFLKELAAAVKRMTLANYQQSPSLLGKMFSVVQGLLMMLMLFWCVFVTLFWCWFIMEASLFTIMGGAMLPTMAFPYFVLVGSIGSALYSLVHTLHEDYEKIISNIIDILESERTIPSARDMVISPTNILDLVKMDDPILASNFSIHVTAPQTQMDLELMRSSVTIKFISTGLYNHVVEACHPVRRQVLFIILQVIVMLFYALIVMWIKNVYHLEPDVEQIFELASIVSVTFVPNALQSLAFKRNTDTIMKQKVYFAITEYIMSQ